MEVHTVCFGGFLESLISNLIQDVGMLPPLSLEKLRANWRRCALVQPWGEVYRLRQAPQKRE